MDRTHQEILHISGRPRIDLSPPQQSLPQDQDFLGRLTDGSDDLQNPLVVQLALFLEGVELPLYRPCPSSVALPRRVVKASPSVALEQL